MKSSETNRLSLMSYNIHHGEGLDRRLDLDRIAEVIRRENPDAVTLNEVDSGWERSGNADQPAELAERLGWNVIFAPAITSPGLYGNAVLSRYPLEQAEVIRLPYGKEHRVGLVVRVKAPCPFYVAATHLPNGKDAGALRTAAMRDLTEAVRRHDWSPLVLAGDMNAAPDSEPIELLRRNGVRYMILGQHFIGNEIGSPYLGRPTEDPAILARYVEQSIEALQTGLFSYFAHPDLIWFTGSDDEYRLRMRELCRAAKTLDTPLEINLLGIREGRNYPDERFWRIAAEEGNAVLLGCDAHRPEHILDHESEKKALALVEKLSLDLRERVPLREL